MGSQHGTVVPVSSEEGGRVGQLRVHSSGFPATMLEGVALLLFFCTSPEVLHEFIRRGDETRRHTTVHHTHGLMKLHSITCTRSTSQSLPSNTSHFVAIQTALEEGSGPQKGSYSAVRSQIEEQPMRGEGVKEHDDLRHGGPHGLLHHRVPAPIKTEGRVFILGAAKWKQ